MAVGEGADPDILVSRRGRQLAYSCKFFLIGDFRAIGAEILKSVAGAFAPDPARSVRDIAQLRRLCCGLQGIG
jgi:hypothetical protein